MTAATARHLSVGELAQRLGVPVRTVYQWNHQGTGPKYLAIGRYVRYPLAEVERWERTRQRGGAG